MTKDKKSLKLVVSNQHGAHFMLGGCLLLGAISNGFSLSQIPFILMAVSGYLFIYPVLELIKLKAKKTTKKSTNRISQNLVFSVAVYGIFTLIFAIYCLYHKFSLSYFAIPGFFLLLICIYFSYKNDERSIINDLAAIALLCLLGSAIFYYSNTNLKFTATDFSIFSENSFFMLWIFYYPFIYFFGSTLFVKSKLRERKNVKYSISSLIFHLIILIFAIFIPKIIGIALAITSFRAILFYFYTKPLKVKQIAIIESLSFIIFIYLTILQLF